MFEKGARLVQPFLHLDGQIAQVPVNTDFAEGVKLLEACAHKQFWQANWFLGKAYETSAEYNKSALRLSMAYAQAPDKPEVVHEYIVALLRIEQTARANTIANLWKDSDNPVLRFDAALAKAFFNEPTEALKIVDEFESWPEGYAERVRELRQRIVEKFSSNTFDSSDGFIRQMGWRSDRYNN